MSPGRIRFAPLTPLLIAGALLAVSVVPAHAESRNGPRTGSPTTLRIGVFNQSLTTIAADAEGFVADQGLSVDYLQVTGSTQQFGDLRDGKYDLIITAPDNVVNYRLNESNPLGESFDVQLVGATHQGQNLSLVTQPEIESVADLRGRTLAVDALESGFAYVLYRMLREHGLERGVDYEVVSAGGTSARYDGLLSGEFDAALLTSGFELRAEDAGLRIVESVQEVIPRYLGLGIAAREGWAKRNRDAVVRLLRAYQRANRWALDPANRGPAIELLMAPPGVTRALAERLYAIQTTPGVGIIPELDVDRDGMLAVLELREEFGGFDQPQNLCYLASPSSGLYDESYRRSARRGRWHERISTAR